MLRKTNWRVRMVEYNNMCIQLKIDKIKKNKEIKGKLSKCGHCGNEINHFTNKFCGFCGAKNDHYIKMDSPEEIRNEWELKERQHMEEFDKMMEKLKVELNELRRKKEREM